MGTTAKTSTQSTSTTTTTVSSTTTTTTSSPSTTPSTTEEPSTTTKSEDFSTRFPPRESEFVTTEGGRTMDGSKIIFSDDAINKISTKGIRICHHRRRKNHGWFQDNIL